MKIWKCSAWNDEDDIYMLLVGESKKVIYERFGVIVTDRIGYSFGLSVIEVNEIDGYKIIATK